jgi:hypothetical protein
MSDLIRLDQKFSTFSAHFDPKLVAELNGQLVKLVEFQGIVEVHSHAGEEELLGMHRTAMTADLCTES